MWRRRSAADRSAVRCCVCDVVVGLNLNRILLSILPFPAMLAALRVEYTEQRWSETLLYSKQYSLKSA